MSERQPTDTKTGELNSTEAEGNQWLLLATDFIKEAGNFWDDRLEFRVKLLVILTIWLFINLNLIRCAWNIYGDKISDRFMKPGK